MAIEHLKLKTIVRKKKKLILKKPQLQTIYLDYDFLTTKLGKKLISYFIRSGKKQTSIKLFYHVLITLKQLLPTVTTTTVIKTAILNSLPFYEIRSSKKRGRTTSVTLPIYTKKRRLFLLVKSIRTYLQAQKGPYSTTYSKLLLQLYNRHGNFYSALQKTYQILLKQYPQLRFRWR